jgi:predicted acyltransferase
MDPPSSERLLSLDAFRGLTIAGMILVNNAGDWNHVFPPLQHAAWNGWTVADLIFPFFLFIVGVSMSFSFSRRVGQNLSLKQVYLQITKRTIILFVLGLFLNALYYFPGGFAFSILRIPGVLQRIALVYFFASLIILKTDLQEQAFIATFLLLVYWAVMKLVPVPGYGAGVLTPQGNFAAYLDNLLLSGHLKEGAWDPEGILSTVPAISSALFGVLTGHWIRSPRDPYEKVAGLFVIGSVSLVLGVVWDLFFPINKNLWTSSYVVFTTGMALYFLGVCYWLIDLKGYWRWATPFVVFGVNAIAVYALSIVMDRMMMWLNFAQPDGSAVPCQMWIYEHLYASWAGRWFGAMYASFFYALTYVVLWLGLMGLLYRRKIFIRI